MKEGWEIKKLGECFYYVKNGANIKQTKGAGGYPITRIETLSGGQFHRDKLGFADIFSLEKYSQHVLDNGDILLSHINSKTYVGRSVVYTKEGEEIIIHGMNLLRLKAIEDILSSFFMYYYTLTDAYKKQIASIRKDAVNQSSIATSDLKKLSIPVPPLAEQQRIVSELDCISGIIEKKKQQLTELDNLAQSIFYDMFGDPITNEKGWEVKKLGEVCEYSKTRIQSKDVTVQTYVGVENLSQKCQGKTIAAKVPEDVGLTEYVEGDVLLGNIRPYLKKIWLATYKGGCNGDVLVIRKKINYCNTLVANYLYSCLSTDAFFDYDMKYSKGEKMPRGDKKEIMNYPILLPPLPLQQSFAAKVEAIEKQKALIKQSIAETETLLASRMDYYFN